MIKVYNPDKIYVHRDEYGFAGMKSGLKTIDGENYISVKYVADEQSMGIEETLEEYLFALGIDDIAIICDASLANTLIETKAYEYCTPPTLRYDNGDDVYVFCKS